MPEVPGTIIANELLGIRQISSTHTAMQQMQHRPKRNQGIHTVSTHATAAFPKTNLPIYTVDMEMHDEDELSPSPLPTKKPRIMETFSFFNEDLLAQKINEHFDRLENEETMEAFKIPDNANTNHNYQIDEAFHAKDLYWDGQLSDRFDGSLEEGILYRHAIVDEMKNEVDKAFKKRKAGVMIKGPHGIGKSHSIVNLVRKLLYDSDGGYLVTFIPDCLFPTVISLVISAFSTMRYVLHLAAQRRSLGCKWERTKMRRRIDY